jgi:protease-4
MFSRRHPYLFFMLIFASVVSFSIVMISAALLIGSKRSDYVGYHMGREKVGIIELVGIISESRGIIEKIKRFRDDDTVKAIVLRIDSPGGSVGPSQEIFREVRKTVEKKKVIASMGSVAASGGYYVAAGADGIIANPGTITGSIGVMMGFTNFQKILEKAGLVSVVVKSCEYKDIGSPTREMTEKEADILQNVADRIHNQFIDAIASGRNMDKDKVASFANGRIFSGEEAKELGLVDRLGNLEDAVEWAGRMAGIKGDISSVYIEDTKISLLKYIAESSLKHLVYRIIYPSLSADYMYQPDSQR